jgi:hypothetical protein
MTRGAPSRKSSNGVIVTAMVALTTLNPEARETFNGPLARVASRSLDTPCAATTS